MRIRHGGGTSRVGVAIVQGGPGASYAGSASYCERLDYIAAMVQELKTMSAQANCQTLAHLLDLAYREAVERRACV